MKTLKTKKRITLATVKAFAKRNANKLYSIEFSSFDGMVDMVTATKNAKFEKVELEEPSNYWRIGIKNFYLVGGGDNSFTIFENDEFYGIECYNCCGSSAIAVRKESKQEEPETVEPELNESTEPKENGLRLIKCEKTETVNTEPEQLFKRDEVKQSLHAKLISHAFSLTDPEEIEDFKNAVLGRNGIKSRMHYNIRELSVKGFLGIDLRNYLLSIVR